MRLISLAAPERATLADAVERAWCAAWGALGRDGASQVDDTPQFLRILTPGSSDLLLNAVLRFQQDRPVQRADVEVVLAPFRAAQRPLQWWLRTDAAPLGYAARNGIAPGRLAATHGAVARRDGAPGGHARRCHRCLADHLHRLQSGGGANAALVRGIAA
jgi:hypothetical protein